MKKILFVTATLGGGGAERVMLNLANKMAAKGHQVSIVKTAPEKNPNAVYPLDPAITLEVIQTQHTQKLLRIADKLIQFRRVFRRYKDYTVVSFLPDVNIYCILAHWGLGIRVVVSERNDPTREPNRAFVRRVRDWAYRYADYVVFQTPDAQAYFCEKIRRKSCVIPNPLNLEELPAPALDQEKRDMMIMVCRVKPQKNVGLLIDAIDRIRDSLGSTVVEIYGDGNLYRDTMKQKVADLGLEDRIRFMGPSNNIYEIMCRAKIYISTSDYEGISNTMLEALALGVPSIVTDCPIGGARMFIRPDVNGILVPVGDVQALADQIKRLLHDEQLQKKLAANAVSIRQQLDLNDIAEQWLERL